MSIQKITLLGDIMCEPLMLKAAKTGNDDHDFAGVFSHIKNLLQESDFVIGNLETPLAGKELGYVSSLFSFNAPDSFAAAANDAGIDLLITANNHCLDRGLDGLKRTVTALDTANILHAGTFTNVEERGNTYFNVGNKRYALVAYTYGTNYSANHIMLTEEQQGLVNLLRPQNEMYFVKKTDPAKKSLSQRLLLKALSKLPSEKRFEARKKLGMTVNQAHEDDNLIPETMQPYTDRLIADLKLAKMNADTVLFCPHVGGQFNHNPGSVTKYVFDTAAANGADAIVASHPHVTQMAELKGKIPCFYSLGNFSMSPNSVYLLHENLPDYGLAAHLYIGENGIEKTTFSILKIVEKDLLTVYPVDEYEKICEEKEKLYKDVQQIYETVTGKTLDGGIIRREYTLSQAPMEKREVRDK